ncbi:MAG: hypothetical protein P8M13_11015, partial [Luminiphilus sp.]|nr:hypothetical protein [Luminiphilus sp.]
EDSGEIEDSGGWRTKSAQRGCVEGGCASEFILRLGSVDGGMKNDVLAKQYEGDPLLPGGSAHVWFWRHSSGQCLFAGVNRRRVIQ